MSKIFQKIQLLKKINEIEENSKLKKEKVLFKKKEKKAKFTILSKQK
jgi:hypothetical protein